MVLLFPIFYFILFGMLGFLFMHSFHSGEAGICLLSFRCAGGMQLNQLCSTSSLGPALDSGEGGGGAGAHPPSPNPKIRFDGAKFLNSKSKGILHQKCFHC